MSYIDPNNTSVLDDKSRDVFKSWFSASELAELAQHLTVKLPRTERQCRGRAKREGWMSREVKGKGGKGGIKHEYEPPSHILAAIHAFLKDHPPFLENSGKSEKKVSAPETRASVSAPEAPAAAQPERRGINFGRRAGDFRDAPLEQFIKVPRFDVHAAAGAGPVIHSEQIIDVCAFKPDWVQHHLGVSPRDIALISVKGDGMVPTLASGDLVMVDTHSGRVEDEAVYVLRHNDGDLRVKRIQRKMDGTLVVKNDNKEYSDEVLGPAEAAMLNVVGRVVWRGCRM